MSLVFHISSPIVTVEEFARISGIPVRTVEGKIEKGEFPLLRTALDPDKRSARYINMVKLAQMADAVEFLHPALKGG